MSDGAQPAKKIPTIALEPYKRLVRDGGIEDAATLLDPPSSPFLLVWPYDYVMHRPRQLIAPTALLAVRSKWVWLAAESWKASGYLQHVADYGPWEACQARPMPR